MQPEARWGWEDGLWLVGLGWAVLALGFSGFLSTDGLEGENFQLEGGIPAWEGGEEKPWLPLDP